MTMVTNVNWKALRKHPGRHAAGEGGLFLKVLDEDRAYWVYRYRFDTREHEASLGSAHKLDYAQARARHLDMRKQVEVDQTNPLAKKRAAKLALADPPTVAASPTFAAVADAFLSRQEERGQLGKNPRHRAQWRSTLTKLPESFRAFPVGAINPQHVFEALDPIWAKTPETASRTRGRIAAVLEFAREHDDQRPNPAAWSAWLKNKLGEPKALGKLDRKTGERVARGNHAALGWRELPAFMSRLRDQPGVAARALEFVLLTASRTSEALGMAFDEIDLDARTWTIPASRMKMGREHQVPLSDRAVAILHEMIAERSSSKFGPHPFVFHGGRPRQALSNMSMAMLLRRMKVDVTVHGFRSSFRDWAAAAGVEFEVAEECLAHAIGTAVTRAYLRGSMLERRRPVMASWADYLEPPTAKVVPLKRSR
jgi:integrase